MAKFPLDIGDTIEETLIFWLTRFFIDKAGTHNNEKVKDGKLRDASVDALKASPQSFEEIHRIINDMKRAGLNGPSVFIKPLLLFSDEIIKSKANTLKEIDSEFIRSFLFTLTRNLSNATINNYKNVILNFFKYISIQNENEPNSGTGYVFGFDVKRINGVTSKTKKLPEYMTKEEMQRFLKLLDEYEFGRNANAQIVLRLAIKLIFFTGARVGEITSLKYKDISFDEDGITLKVNGKGNKERIVSISNRNIKKSLDLYLEYIYPLCENKKLFCGIMNHKIDLNSRQVSQAVSEVLESAKISKRKKGAHLLRHTYATYVYGETRDLRLLQDLLGHADSKTTQIYTHIDDERIKKTRDLF